MFLAWKEIKKNKGKYAIVTLVLISTIYLVLFTISLSRGLQKFGASKIMNSTAETFILNEGSSSSMESSSFSGAHATQIQESLGLEDAFILGVQLANVQETSNPEETFEIAYWGITSDTFMTPEIIEGRAPQGENEAVASSSIQNEGVEIGSTIWDNNMNIQFTIVGFTEDDTYNYSPIVYVSPEQFVDTSFLGQITGYANVQAVVTQEMPENIPPSIVEEFGVDIVSRDEIIQATPGLYAQSVSFFLLIVSIYFISGTILAMFFYIITIQKKKEYGLLKAFGSTNTYIAKAIIAQVLMIVAIGILVSLGLILLTDALLPDVVPFLLEPSFVIGGSFLFLGVALLGSLASLVEINRVDPIVVIGGNN